MISRILTLTFCSLLFINCTNQSSTSEAKEEVSVDVQVNKTVDGETNNTQVTAGPASGIISLEVAKGMLDAGNVQFVDLRTPEEIAETGKIPGAIELNMRDGQFKNNFQRLDGRTPIVFYCKAGGRSARAMGMAEDLQFSRVYDMTDGMDGWSKKYETN